MVDQGNQFQTFMPLFSIRYCYCRMTSKNIVKKLFTLGMHETSDTKVNFEYFLFRFSIFKCFATHSKNFQLQRGKTSDLR